MSRRSAGILLYHFKEGTLRLLLVHPGGPYHVHKDLGDWSIPKGEFAADEDPLAAAKREFEEEIGQPVPATAFFPLGPVMQQGHKEVHAWAAEGRLDVTQVTSNTFPMEYPYKSGRWIQVPEVDRAEWFDPDTARLKINPGQVPLIDELVQRIATGDRERRELF